MRRRGGAAAETAGAAARERGDGQPIGAVAAVDRIAGRSRLGRAAETAGPACAANSLDTVRAAAPCAAGAAIAALTADRRGVDGDHVVLIAAGRVVVGDPRQGIAARTAQAAGTGVSVLAALIAGGGVIV